MRERILFVVCMLSEFQRWANCQNNGHFSVENRAIGKPARQEPETLLSYTADRAIDGDTSWPACTHTYGPYTLPSSWTVELGMSLYVNRIIIYNRGITNGKDFNYRLQNFIIYGITPLAKDIIYNDTNNNSYVHNVIRLEMFDSRAYTAIQIGIPARKKPLYSDFQNVLTLCEVQVYGDPAGCQWPKLDSHVRIVARPTEGYIIVTCEAGYTPTANAAITCNNDFVWSGSQPKCNPVRCESPGKVDNGYYEMSNEATCNSRNISDLHYQCKIKPICNEGYRLRDQSERTCQPDGRWTTPHPFCDIVTCDFPGDFLNGKYIIGTNNDISYVSGSLNYSTTIEVQCNTGYELQNSAQRICESTGKWSGEDPQCEIVQCSIKELKSVVNGHYILNGESEFDGDFANYNDTLSVICTKGFTHDSNGSATCSVDGKWSSQPSSCTVVTCLTPIETSYVKYQTWYNTSYGTFTDKLPYGATVDVNCTKGLLKAGSRIRYCQENGSWDGENPVCVSLCDAPEVTNGMLKDDNKTLIDTYEEGQNISLTCSEGYESIHGQGYLTCQKDHSWTYLPSCLRSPDSQNSAQIAAVGGAVGGCVVIIAILVLVIMIYRNRKGDKTGLLKRYVRFQTSHTSEYAEILVTDTTRDQAKRVPSVKQSEDIAVEASNVEYYNTNKGHTNEAYCSVNASNTMPEGAIRVENLSDIVLSGQNALAKLTEEFKMFPDGLTEKHSEAIKKQNKGRNRYKNLYAYDETRVVLEKETSEESDYINACYIDGFQLSREYIASQGTTKDMIPDFWKMVWQTDSSKIVMLTRLREEDKIKCVQYWPDSGSMEYGKITVSLEDSDIHTDFTMRKLKIKKAGYPERTVIQFHFTAWPDRGVPTHASSIVQFRNKVINTQTCATGPMIVHCSAGVGRTGTFIALDYLTKQGQKNGYVDVVGTVKALRKQRVNLVQTLEQYIFVHHALVETLMLSTSALSTSKFPEAYRDLLDVDRNTGKRNLDHEFKKSEVYWPDKGENISFGRINVSNDNILEIDSHKIVLMTLTANSETRCIKQIQCTGWMSGNPLPKSPAVMLSLLELVQAWQQQTGNQPIVVHCMNGAEKSGLFCVVSAVIERLKVEQDVAIAHIVGDMGRAREQIIPNAEQYQFVHEVVLAYIQQNETYSNFSLIHGKKETC